MDNINRTILLVVIYFMIVNRNFVISTKTHPPNYVRINKCCEENEIRVDSRCERVNSSVTGKWTHNTKVIFITNIKTTDSIHILTI